MRLLFWRRSYRAKCPKCGSGLSEWFRQDGDKMRCFDCGFVTKWHTHKEALAAHDQPNTEEVEGEN